MHHPVLIFFKGLEIYNKKALPPAVINLSPAIRNRRTTMRAHVCSWGTYFSEESLFFLNVNYKSLLNVLQHYFCFKCSWFLAMKHVGF